MDLYIYIVIVIVIFINYRVRPPVIPMNYRVRGGPFNSNESQGAPPPIIPMNFGAVGLILTESENHSALSGVTRFTEIHIPFRDAKMEWGK